MLFPLSFFPFLLVYSFLVFSPFIGIPGNTGIHPAPEDPKPIRSRLEPDFEYEVADRIDHPDMEPATRRQQPDSQPRDRPAIDEPTIGQRHIDDEPDN